MNITLFSQDIVWLDVDSNLEKVNSLARKLKRKSDLIVLPEMFNTGYTMSPHLLEPDTEAKTRNILAQISKENDISIIGTIPALRDEKYYNSMVIAINGIVEDVYDKIHLFSLAGEHQHYTAGFETKTFTFDNWSLLPLICYDLRFPYAAFGHSQKDVIIYCANWPIVRIEQWKILLRARAVENQCYVIGVNRTGKDGNGYVYNGNSLVVDFMGNDLYCSHDLDEYHTIEIDIKSLKDYRSKLPFLKDKVVV